MSQQAASLIMNKRISSAIVALLVLLFAVVAFSGVYGRSDGFVLEKYGNADAKFYGNYVVTSLNGEIQLLDFQGNVLNSYPTQTASWVYTCQEANMIIYTNHIYETHLMHLDEQRNLLSDTVISVKGLLCIDPTICKVGNQFFFTHTTVDGMVNNSSPDGENGIYSVELYSSKDLENWEHCATIISENHDIEDIDLLQDGNRLYCIYEKENYDKGPSKICMKSSEDNGFTWSEETVLIENGGDNEFSCALQEEDGWRIFYSSDKENPGESYNGASAYSAFFDSDFQYMSEYDEKLDMKDNHSVRLYEVKEVDGRLYLLFAQDYMTDKDFVLKCI